MGFIRVLLASFALCACFVVRAEGWIVETEVTDDGDRTAFYLKCCAGIEWGGNFIRVLIEAPNGITDTTDSGFLWPTDASGNYLPWGNYGELLAEEANFVFVVERTWSKSVRYTFILADRDGVELDRTSYFVGHRH